MATVAPQTGVGAPPSHDLNASNTRTSTGPVVSSTQLKASHNQSIPQLESPKAERERRKLYQTLALRWLGVNGYGREEGGGGHVTVRDPIMADHFWINPPGKSFRHMLPEDLCLVNEQGVLVEGGNMHGVVPVACAIYSTIHKARPDVMAAVHCYSASSKTYSSFGRLLEPMDRETLRLYHDHAVAPFGGLTFESSEGPSIAAALGPSYEAIMFQNHGHLTVGKTVDVATLLFHALDRSIQAQLAMGSTMAGLRIQSSLVDQDAKNVLRKEHTEDAIWRSFQPAFKDATSASKGELPLTVPDEVRRA